MLTRTYLPWKRIAGLKVFAGARVWLPNISIGRDPSLWSEPDRFLPERWIGHDEETGAEVGGGGISVLADVLPRRRRLIN